MSRLTSAPAKAFLVAALTLLSSGVAHADYWDQRLSDVTVTLPKHIKSNTRAARTYEYWSRASQDIQICTDVETVDKLNVFQKFFLLKPGDRIWEAMRAIPTKGVDPEAVQSVNLVLSKVKLWVQATTAAFTTGVNFLAGMMVGSALGADGTPPTPMDFATAPLDGIGNVGQGSGAKGIERLMEAKNSIAAMVEDMKAVEAKLTATRKRLEKKYHTKFPHFSVTGREPSGLCNYESGLF